MDTERDVRELVDRQAIADVIHAYCFHFDQNEPERVAELFTANATVDYGPEAATIVWRTCWPARKITPTTKSEFIGGRKDCVARLEPVCAL